MGGRGVAPVVRLQGEELHRLAEPHVVGQQGAQTELGEERQPRQAALLVGAQLCAEARRGGDRGDRPVGPPLQKIAEETLRAHRGDGERHLLVGGPVVGMTACERQHLADRGRALRRSAAQERQARPQLLGIDAHPPAAHPHELCLGRHELGQLLLAELLVTDGHRPAKIGQLLAAEAAAREHAVGGGAAGRQREPHPARPVPPAGQLHPEPGVGQQRRIDGEELVRAAVLQVERLRTGRTKGGCEVGHHAGGPPQLGEQQLLRIGQQPRGAAVPDLPCRHEQAQIGGGLEEELQDPVGAVAGLIVLIVAGIGGVVQGAHLGQPEARPPCARRARADGIPLVEGVGELGQLALARLDPRVRCGERTQPRRDRGAATGPPRRRERDARAGQPVAHRRVGEHRERIVHERLWIGTALVAGRGLLGPPDRRQRLDERLDRHGIQPTDDRPPPRVGRARLADQRGQDAAAGGEIISELGEGAQVRHRGAVAGLFGGIGQLGDIDGQCGHRPRPQHRLGTRRPVRPRAHQLRRRDRAAGTRREQQRERGGLAGVQRRERRWIGRERVRPGRAQRARPRRGGAISVFGPQQHAAPRRPEGVNGEHGLRLRPATDVSGRPGAERARDRCEPHVRQAVAVVRCGSARSPGEVRACVGVVGEGGPMTAMTQPISWNRVLTDQLVFHWEYQLRSRLDGAHRRGVPVGAGAGQLERAPPCAGRPAGQRPVHDRLDPSRAHSAAGHHDRLADRAHRRRRLRGAHGGAFRRPRGGVRHLALSGHGGGGARPARHRLRGMAGRGARAGGGGPCPSLRTCRGPVRRARRWPISSPTSTGR